ncbi:ead/Ea22-like family protein [Escherichia coli]|nr:MULTISPECIES: ead/Ea22-like family protein [Enterobacteriaceae]EFW8115314.1 ead/Ea22-like family protein [Shigella sonnei]KDZ58321.1 ead/Ea22-like family protein [Escherichia coli 3-073-06_S1_C2]EES9065513.1 ead/Ea22-like family protein [Escherichia coli]EEU2170700.1 ead/Ea22-like family protein [Escherichia coli]EEU3659663.1 ead/Ea22-like family protein [Escherichia coli]
MSEINYQALREKAEKATKGSYIVGHTSVNQHGNLTGVFVCQKWKGEPGGVIAECHVNCLIESDAQAYANAEFIADANPATVLALLDERERNQQYIKRRDQENEDIALTVGKLRVELEETKSKLNEQREYYEGVISDGSKRIAELEEREIKPAKGEVLVVVSGFTGCGKSAIAGEIEIAMKAIGVPVQWTNGDAEKRMTGADWLTAIEMYKPTVRIVEVNVPHAAGIRIKGE